jgi:hypothetical protein
MADPTQNTGGQGKSAVNSARDLRENIRETLKLQGDYNNELKYSIQDLDRQIKQYQTINAKIATLEKTSINIKELNKDILRQNQKQVLTNVKLRDLEKEIGEKGVASAEKYTDTLAKRERQEKGLILAQRNKQKGLEDYFSKALVGTEKELEKQQSLLNIKELSYVAGIKEQKLNDEALKALQAQLAVEKQISQSIGLTGAVFKNFADKLGIGERYYEQMVAKARELNAEGKKFGMGEKLKVLGSAAKGALGEIANDPIALLGAAIPLVGGLISGVVSGIKTVFDFMLGIQDKTVKFGRALGVSTEQATLIKKQFGIINLTNGDLLVNTDKLIDSQTELVGLLGTTNILTSEQLATNIKLKDLLGLDAQARASIAQSSVITGKSSQEITESILAQVEGLKAATGIGLDYRQVLDQASKLGGALGLQFAQFPGKIAKALVVTKSFGLELKQLDGLAGSFLDFESSISKEFEAQVLLGRQINLTKARQAFLDNDLATAAAEISKSAGDYLDFNKMNRIQQEAIAAAVGMNRDQLGDMLKNQLYLDKLGAKETASSTEKLKLAKERFKTEEEINKQLGEGAYQNLVTMSATEKIAAFIEKIKVSIGDFLTNSGIIDKLTQLFDYFSKPENIRTAIGYVRDFVFALTHMIGTLVNGVAGIARFFYVISHEDKESVADFFSQAEGSIATMGTGGMSDAATLNTGTVASQRVPASNTNSPAAAANAQAPFLANPNFNLFIDGQQVHTLVKERFEQDSPAK